MKDEGGIVAAVRQYIRENSMLMTGDRIIVGISGGADSVCLLQILKLLQPEYSLYIGAVHVHHGIRKESAEADLEFAKELCKRLDVEFFEYRIDVPLLAHKNGLTIEEAGRRARYDAFRDAMKRTASNITAVAHHRDDLAETVLMNLLRGSGIKGLAGIAPVRSIDGMENARIIRPLLCLEKRQIVGFLWENGLPWRTDETNSSNEYFRNRVRNSLIPELKKSYNPGVTEHLAAAAADLREADAYLEESARELVSGWKIDNESSSLSYPAKKLAAVPHILAAYIVRGAIAQLCGLKDISRRHVDEILSLLDKPTGKKVVLPQGVRAELSYDTLSLSKTNFCERRTYFETVFSIFPYDKDKKLRQDGCLSCLDYDRIKSGFLLRTRREGDRICVMEDGRTQKLKDFMINRKIPRNKRENIPLLAAGSDILCIPGVRVAADCRVTDSTRLILQIRIIEKHI